MNDDDLTRQAAQELIRDAKKFMRQREGEFRATQMKQPMQMNKRFLGNTIKAVVAYNKSQDRSRKAGPSASSSKTEDQAETENKTTKQKKSPKKSPKGHHKTAKKAIEKRGKKR